jgi:hypothetical protein
MVICLPPYTIHLNGAINFPYFFLSNVFKAISFFFFVRGQVSDAYNAIGSINVL